MKCFGKNLLVMHFIEKVSQVLVGSKQLVIAPFTTTTDIKAESIHEEAPKDKQLDDFSKYLEESEYYDAANNLRCVYKKLVGLKEECTLLQRSRLRT